MCAAPCSRRFPWPSGSAQILRGRKGKMRFVVEAMGLTDSGGKRVGVNLLSKLPAHACHEFVLLIPDAPEYGQIQGSNIKAIRRPVPEPLLARDRKSTRLNS